MNDSSRMFQDCYADILHLFQQSLKSDAKISILEECNLNPKPISAFSQLYQRVNESLTKYEEFLDKSLLVDINNQIEEKYVAVLHKTQDIDHSVISESFAIVNEVIKTIEEQSQATYNLPKHLRTDDVASDTDVSVEATAQEIANESVDEEYSQSNSAATAPLEMIDDPSSQCCGVCFKANSSEEDRLLQCQECNVLVHESCYGTSSTTDSWKCSRCKAGKAPSTTPCVLCGRVGGAMKPMKGLDSDIPDKWAHLVCCWWDPDTAVEDTKTMEPIAFVRKPSLSRVCQLFLNCQLCLNGTGYCIPCCWDGCARPIHAICAKQFGYLNMDIDTGIVSMQAYCDRHKNMRFDIKTVVQNILQPNESKDVFSKASCSKISDILQHLNSQNHYESLDNVMKDLAAVFTKTGEEVLQAKGGSTSRSKPFFDAFNGFIKNFRQLRNIYSSFTLSMHELFPASLLKHIQYYNYELASSCYYCDQSFLLSQTSIFCTNESSIHEYHPWCVNGVKDQPCRIEDTVKSTRRREASNNLVPIDLLPKSKSTIKPNTFRSSCANCESKLDIRAIKYVSLKKPKKRDSGKLNLVTGERGTSIFGLPSMLDINMEAAKNLVTMLQGLLDSDYLKNFAITKEYEVPRLHISNRLQAALDIAVLCGDRYARMKLKRAMAFIKNDNGPAHTIIRLLVRDYSRLMKQRQHHDEEMATLEKERAIQAEIEKKENEAKELKEREAEILLKQQQAEIKQSLKKRKKTKGIGKDENPPQKVKKQNQFFQRPTTPGSFRKRNSPRIRYQRCNNCEACKSPDCRACIFCLDMKKYGGTGTRKRCCITRVCMNPQAVPLLGLSKTHNIYPHSRLAPFPGVTSVPGSFHPHIVPTRPNSGSGLSNVPHVAPRLLPISTPMTLIPSGITGPIAHPVPPITKDVASSTKSDEIAQPKSNPNTGSSMDTTE